MKSKKGEISLVVWIGVTAIVVFIIWWITSGSINETSGSILDSLREKVGLGENELDTPPSEGGIPTEEDIMATTTLEELEELRTIFEQAYLDGKMSKEEYDKLYDVYVIQYNKLA